MGGVLVDRLSTISHVFHVKNTRNRSLRVLGVQKSCGCLEASIDRDLIAPYQEALLTLSASVTPSYSAKTVHCVLRTDDPDNATLTYSLAFQTFPRVQFRPLALNLGSLRRTGTAGDGTHSAVEASLEVFRASGEEVDSVARLDVPGGLSAALRGAATTDEPAKGVVRISYRVRVQLRADGPTDTTGSRRQLVIGALTRRGEQASLPVAWAWQEAVEASPSNVSFGALTGATSEAARVLVRSTEDRSFRILSILGDDSASVEDLRTEAIGGDSPRRLVHSVSFRLRLSNPSVRASAGTVTIVTDDDACPRLPVRWSAFVERHRDDVTRIE
jgi:Protein of unknown function (DUF1573)